MKPSPRMTPSGRLLTSSLVSEKDPFHGGDRVDVLPHTRGDTQLQRLRSLSVSAARSVGGREGEGRGGPFEGAAPRRGNGRARPRPRRSAQEAGPGAGEGGAGPSQARGCGGSVCRGDGALGSARFAWELNFFHVH